MCRGTRGRPRRRHRPRLPVDIAAAAVEFITGPILDNAERVGKPLGEELAGIYSAHVGRNWRVLFGIDDTAHALFVFDVSHLSPRGRAGRRTPRCADRP